VYREGKNSHFNVPFEKKEHFLTEDTITKIKTVYELLKDDTRVSFTTISFEDLNPLEGDFVYLDPPYTPSNSTSFTSYKDGGFGKDDILSNKLNEWGTKLVKLRMSNSKEFLGFLENRLSFFVKIVECRRSVNSKDPSQVDEEIFLTRN